MGAARGGYNSKQPRRQEIVLEIAGYREIGKAGVDEDLTSDLLFT